MIVQRFLLLLFLMCIGHMMLAANFVNVGLFHKLSIKTTTFQPVEGTYSVYTDQGKVATLSSKDAIELVFSGNHIIAKTRTKALGNFKSIKLIGTAQKNSFELSVNKKTKKRHYEDNLLVTQHDYYDYMQLVNNISVNNYISGVVEAEVGIGAPEEYFKLQAIICRTYALKNAHRHQDEGFGLCDKVHCQAYHGVPRSKAIKHAAYQTDGIIIVDSDINLITATFYSNCGGQTANSEEVWKRELYYLRSVQDTFCLHEHNATWTKKIATTSWQNYIKKHGYPERDHEAECNLQYFQNSREQFFWDNNTKIPLVDIRKDWKLKSTQFDIIPQGDLLIFKGKGFGHGVGLCQEGAMKMAKLGYTYTSILHAYYKGVHMIDINYLDFFKEDF